MDSCLELSLDCLFSAVLFCAIEILLLVAPAIAWASALSFEVLRTVLVVGTWKAIDDDVDLEERVSFLEGKRSMQEWIRELPLGTSTLGWLGVPNEKGPSGTFSNKKGPEKQVSKEKCECPDFSPTFRRLVKYEGLATQHQMLEVGSGAVYLQDILFGMTPGMVIMSVTCVTPCCRPSAKEPQQSFLRPIADMHSDQTPSSQFVSPSRPYRSVWSQAFVGSGSVLSR